MGTLKITTDVGKVSDGYHTFSELYDHRCHLFIALMLSNPKISWRALFHDDGTEYPDWFVAGMNLPSGDISYHLPMWMWGMLDKKVKTYRDAPKWDGHTPADVLLRIFNWIGSK